MISAAINSHYLMLLSLYVISPIDIIPEFLFGLIGFIDDLFVFAAILITIANFY